MDRTWMYETRRTHPVFMREASTFIDKDKTHALRESRKDIFCPCVDCKNEKMWKDPDVILGHIIQRGFVEKYTVWTYHGEVAPPVEIRDIWFDQAEDFIIDDMSRQMTSDFVGSVFDAAEVDIDLDLEDMLRHVEPEVLTEKAKDLNNWEALQKSAKDLLYDQSKGCDMQYTGVYPRDHLAVVLDLAHYGEETFTEFLVILNLAQKYYVDHGGPINNPQKKKLLVKTRWPCFKQPPQTNLCGYYVCEMLRLNGRYTTKFEKIPSVPVVANRFDDRTILNLCADICRFIRRDVCNHLGDFYDPESQLATEDTFKRLREWEKEHMYSS